MKSVDIALTKLIEEIKLGCINIYRAADGGDTGAMAGFIMKLHGLCETLVELRVEKLKQDREALKLILE